MATNNTRTITNTEYFNLLNKAKKGWKMFYIYRDEYDDLNTYYHLQIANNKKLVEQIRSGQQVDLDYLKKQFVELYEKVGEANECPCCFETLLKDNMFIPNCGHFICKTCKDTIMNGNKLCPLCKKNLA